ncbi:MAG: carboxypeptidase regulatory-like domain-containing protein, partial [Acidobacteriaceae bacterium]|nr:carboxypeptidase regulatory-like domain-containing protein [Acidobacteriaceae bacterium]
MSKSLLVGLPIALAIAIAANAQAVDANPNANTNDVFLDNHRPLLPKKEKPPTARTVTGKVVDDTGQPVDGALVTITNEKTHERRQFITKQDGRYSFGEVSFTIDYELAAQY